MLGLLLMFVVACKTTKLVPEGQHLLVKNKLISSDSSNNLLLNVMSKLDDEKALYIRHKPNRSILLLGKFHLGLYNLGSSKKHPERSDSSRFRTLLRSYGEAPVILDTNQIEKSELNLQNYLISKGYFNCYITHSIQYKGKKATVIYNIIPAQTYTIQSVNLFADDAEVDVFLNQNMSKSYLTKGSILDLDMINKERNRLTLLMRNNGYFDFTKDYIDFELDTSAIRKGLNISIAIANKSNQERFEKLSIQKIKVVFENDSETQKLTPPITFNGVEFHFNGFPIKPQVIFNALQFQIGDLFKVEEMEHTYAKLSEFSLFKFIDIGYKPSVIDSIKGLEAIVSLKTNYRQTFTIEPQGIMSQLNRIQNINLGNSYGVANSLIWTHRNLFHNAELFNISANTRIEAQLYRDTNTNKIKHFNPAYQQSLNLSLSIPKSSILKPLEKLPQVKSIKTNFNLSLLYEKNPDYLRKIIPLTYQYQISTTRANWFINVFEMSFSRNTLKIDISKRADSAFIQRLFSNNLITSSGLSFLFSDKNTTKSRSSFFIRANVIEFGGNIHRLIRRTLDTKQQADTSYQLFKVNYYQYAKSEIDARCSTVFSENHSSILRFNLGLTYPYGNQLVVPFDKLFFIGGANSLRAWRPRTIGPGSYAESSKNFRIDRAGNLIIQANAEYRFDIIDKKVEGALFVDAGNVWLARNVNNVDPLKLFKPRSFLFETAMNTGIGLRFDFEFFLFRLDWGMQIKNPEKPVGETLVIKDFARNKYFTKYSILNFGIGYPF